jgi:hypothetical protein
MVAEALIGFASDGRKSAEIHCPVSEVTGTFAWNPGEQTQAMIDRPVVRLNQQGDARFAGQIDNIPASWANPPS